MLLNETIEPKTETRPASSASARAGTSSPEEPPEARLRVSRRPDGQLELAGHRDAGPEPVRLSLCFPWTEPTRYVSLRDSKGNEAALIRNLGDLEPASREVLHMAVAEAGFVIEIESVLSVEDEFELRAWKVRTPLGERSFQTKTDDWPRRVPGGALVIRDVNGDLFCIRRPESLDARSRELLWAYID